MKTAQALMEFIMTYGWAILVVLIAVIALTYFGIINPQEALAKKCITAQGINCIAYKAQETKVTLNLQNKLNKEIKIKQIELADEKNCEPASFDIILKNKESSEFKILCDLIPGNMVTSKLIISYDEIDGLKDQINSGSLNTRVQ
jgi:preprotein translocase subunit YajC